MRFAARTSAARQDLLRAAPDSAGPRPGLINPTKLNKKVQEHGRSEEHTSELQSLMRISYAVFCLKKKKLHVQPIHKQRGFQPDPLQITPPIRQHRSQSLQPNLTTHLPPDPSIHVATS